MCSTGQALCNRLKESVTNVTQPGNQWHSVGNESCDGRGRPHQLLSLCVYSEHSLHPGSCWDLRGGPCQPKPGPGTLLNHGNPAGAFLEKSLQCFRHSDHQLNQLQLWTEHCCRTSGELFSFQTWLCPHMRNQSVRS